MKKYFFATLVFMFICLSGHAQIVYRPFISDRSTSSSSSNQSSGSYQGSYLDSYQGSYQTTQTIRTTAYYLDTYNEQYIKVPIKVSITTDGYNTQIKIVEKYVSTGFGGQWQKVYNSGTAKSCSTLTGSMGLGSDVLEQQFMYKAFVDSRYWYFDL